MASTAAVTCLLTISFFLLAAEGADVCEVRGKGKMTQFNGDNLYVKLPCKYLATVFSCQGYNVRLAPGQTMDSNSRYFINTLWISIEKQNTANYWKGRTSTSHVIRALGNPATKPFRTMRENMSGPDSFSLQMTNNFNDQSATLKVDGTGLEISFYAYNELSQRLRKNAGFRVSCPDASFSYDSQYPDTICGVANDTYSVKLELSELDLDSRPQTGIYHILLNDKVKQINPQCETATRVFHDCSPEKRADVIKACSSFVENSSLIRCLDKNLFNAMNVFVYCMKYKCENDGQSCEQLKDAAETCSSVSTVLPGGGQCPSVEI